MSAWLIALPSYQTWPLIRVAALLVVVAVLVLATLPLLVTALVGLRSIAATERAMRLIPVLPAYSEMPADVSGSDRR